jgi:hypothetical protein
MNTLNDEASGPGTARLQTATQQEPQEETSKCNECFQYEGVTLFTLLLIHIAKNLESPTFHVNECF